MSKTIHDYTAAVAIDAANDYLLIDPTSTGVYKKISRNVLLGVTGTPADLATVQTFTNKVIGNTNTVTLKDTLFTLQDDGDTTKQAKFQLSGITTATTRTYTLPNASSTLVDLVTSQTLTSKTLTSPVISGGSIDNTTITVDSIAEHTAANGVTIDGMSIKDGKLNTNNSVVTASITDAAVTAAKLATGALYLGSASITANFVSGTTVTTDVTGLSTTVTVPAGGRRVRIWVQANVYNTAGADTVSLFIVDSTASTTLATLKLKTAAINIVHVLAGFALHVPAAGSRTYKVQIGGSGSNGPAVEASATQPAYIAVEAV
jgi:hypothetical protein